MKKYLFITLIYFFTSLFVVQNTYSQDLSDVDVQVIPLTGLYRTDYGYVAQYTTTDVKYGEIYLPYKWFQSSLEDKKETTHRVRASKIYTALNIFQPQLKITYEKGLPSRILVIVPTAYIVGGTPSYYNLVTSNPKLETQEDKDRMRDALDSLEEKFTKQLETDFIIFDEYRRKLESDNSTSLF